jgi:hypothetical protein
MKTNKKFENLVKRYMKKYYPDLGYDLDFNADSLCYHLTIYCLYDDKPLYATIDFPYNYPVPLPKTEKNFRECVKIDLVIGMLVKYYLRGDLDKDGGIKFPGVSY